MIWIYRLLVWPLLLFIQLLRPFLSGKVRQVIEEKNLGKFRSTQTNLKPQNPIWIHAASGEIEYAKPLIRALKKRNPHLQILLTFTSPSAIPMIEKMNDVDFWGPLPWETPWELRQFLRLWKPRLLLVARTDVWPEMSEQVALANIPSYLFSATFADNSSRLKWPVSIFTRTTLEKLSGVFVVSTKDLENLNSISPQFKNVKVLGDTRFDQVFYRLEQKTGNSEKIHPQKKTFLLGSTWPEDDREFLPYIQSLIQQEFQIIWAPHELSPEHLAHLKNAIEAQNLRLAFYSQAQDPNWDVLIVDRMGVLAELYLLSQVAFIGGSFRKQVHSVMEALAAGNMVFVGPHHLNNREAIDFQNYPAFQTYSAVNAAESGQEIVGKILNLDWKKLKSWNQALVHEIRKNEGSSEKLVSRIPQSLLQ